MAKVKKQEKPIEQRLEEALVLYEKTPYKLPSNWCWTRLIHLVNHQSGNSKLIKGKLSSEKADGLYDGYSASGQDVFCPNYEHEGNAIIVSAVGARCGKAFLAKGKWSAIANTHIIYPNDGMDIKYLFYLMNDEKWWVRSGSAQPFVVVKESLERPFALPPYQEQKRIVELIEKQFAKLDEARELIQKSLDTFADRKSVILHKAFIGELTKQWRENNGRAFSFKRKTFDEVAKIKSNLVEPSEYLDMPHIAPDCIEKFTGKLIGYKTIREDGVFSPKHRCYKNQILYSKIRPNLSKLIIAEFDCLCSADMYPIEANENVKYLFYAMLSSEFLEQASNAGSRSVLPKINQKELSRLFIDIPNIDEQEEIVRILDSIFEKEDKSKELIDMLDKIDEMKKSILARAFRGQLGTSNPTDEPATDLLKKILEQNN